ncbi:rDNA transcriptional regulator pol5 [Hyphodiscus hymeniophilus]|uniref:rDNA transcriptional regulator pol5 n=1 Tax=Hyphodiscus hymeniophilus TaxID=353542 RepID=A0A9P7AYJ3_9HELO|nr:rDNA transcriptional regulator pol5 [Hyphodiscus hymeniophilus]
MGSKRKRSAQDASTAAPVPKKQQKSADKTLSKASTPPPLDTSPFLDNPKGADLKREVQLYELLGSEDTAERLNAAGAIIAGLLDGDGVEESTLQRHLERRLFRGLASGRKGSRLGFSIVLAEILGQLFGTNTLSATKYTGLTFEKVLGFLIAKTKPDGDLSGQEERDHALGLLFGLQSFVRANILFGRNETWNIILTKFLDLAKKKPWIREECGWVIVEALAQMNQKEAEFTLNKLQEEGLGQSPEGVGIWLTARNAFPDMKFPNKPWGQSGNPLEHLKPLAKALKESSSNSEKNSQQAKQTGTWNAQLHFAWNIVLAQYAQGLKDKTDGISNFENFWKVAVDENLFSSTASQERKFWGFLLFQKVLQDPNTYSTLFPIIFSHNLVRSLINQLQEKDRFLYRAADKSLKVLIHTVESAPQTLLTILPQLIGRNGIYDFDRVTKTKTIEKLLTKVDGSNARTVVDALVMPIKVVEGDDHAKIVEMRRQVLGDYLLDLAKRVDVTDEALSTTWVGEIVLPTLTSIAYCSDSAFQPPVSERTRILFRNRLMSIFNHLLTNLNGFSYPCTLIQTFAPDAVGMDEHITDAKDKALSTMNKILKKAKKAEGQEKAAHQALALLYSLVLFQLYNGESEALSILAELKLCYDKFIRHKDNEDSDAEASEVLVELLLSFISKPSALLRKVTQHVFSVFISDLTKGGLKLMTDVLESGETLRGQQELFDQEPEDEDIMDVDEDDEMDSDVEVVDMNGDEGTFNGHLAEDSEDEDESEDENGDGESSVEEDDEEARKLDDALAKALGTHRLDQDLAAEDSDSDADMTDSEMMALDSKLVEIFSQRKKQPNKKQEQKDAKETMVNFKSRVLDLLEIYVRKQATNPLAFRLLLPLLQLIRTTKNKQLAQKSYNIILSFAKGAKKESVAVVNVAEQVVLLKAIHTEASKDLSHVFAKSASTSSLLVASSLYRADKNLAKKIATVYRDSQVAWIEGEVKMQASFFIDWVNWCQSHANL